MAVKDLTLPASISACVPQLNAPFTEYNNSLQYICLSHALHRRLPAFDVYVFEMPLCTAVYFDTISIDLHFYFNCDSSLQSTMKNRFRL